MSGDCSRVGVASAVGNALGVGCTVSAGVGVLVPKSPPGVFVGS